MASNIGMTIISFNEKLPLFEETIRTMRMAEIIVVGTEYFFIPKYSGMRHMPDAAIAFISTAGICCVIIATVNLPGINSKWVVMEENTVVKNTFERIMEQNVKRITIASFDAISFFLLIGYKNNVVIVLFLISPIISLEINVAAKIIKVALTIISIPARASV